MFLSSLRYVLGSTVTQCIFMLFILSCSETVNNNYCNLKIHFSIGEWTNHCCAVPLLKGRMISFAIQLYVAAD